MKIEKTLIWSIINDKDHPSFTERKKIKDIMPVIDQLFP